MNEEMRQCVIGYCRASTDGQVGDDKYGLDAQRDIIQKYCDLNGYYVSKWYIDEGASGVSEDRPEFNKIVYGDVENPPIEKVIVAKSDRVARDIQLYFYFKMLLQKRGVEIVSVNEDFGAFGPYKDILQSFVMFVAQMERQNITARTSSGRSIKAAQGGYSGGRAPVGYRVANRKLVINPEESPIVELVFAWRKEGHTMKQIMDELNKTGFKTRRGGSFFISNVQSILSNEKTYRGLYRYGKNGQWVKGEHEAILKGGETQ